MPQVELCFHCRERIDKEQQPYVVISKGTATVPEKVAHAECFKNSRQKSSQPGRVTPHW